MPPKSKESKKESTKSPSAKAEVTEVEEKVEIDVGDLSLEESKTGSSTPSNSSSSASVISESSSTVSGGGGAVKPLRGAKARAAAFAAAKAEEESAANKAAEIAAGAGHGGAFKAAAGAAARVATGILTSEKGARDIKISSFSLNLHGHVLVEDTEIELNVGARYGLLGRNGCGKTTLLQCIANRDIPVPAHIDTYLLSEEAPKTDMSAVEFVVDSAKREMERLEVLGEKLLEDEGPDSEALMDVYDRQSELDPSTFVSRASTILIGLGFDNTTIHKKTKDMSGGWRMRVALAHALFISPALLLLDEPTNHLDLEACVWLEDYLSRYPKILVVVSHSQDFLNGVCTDMMVMQNRKLRYWGGNYDTYLKTREEQERNQIKQYEKQQEEIAHIKAFIASCGTYANLVRQAKSREKQLEKMKDDGLFEMPFRDPVFRFIFPETSKPAPPLISFQDVAFSYSGKPEDYLFTGLRFGIDSDSRIALVGPNGAGKTTLLKLMVAENHASVGTVAVKSGLSLGRYHQHSADVLDLEQSPVDYISSRFHDRYPEKKLEEWRSVVGLWGIPSDYHLVPIKCLSDGLKTRLVFCEIALKNPHILLLDEPTNAADMEMIDSMAAAIKAFKGGVIVISHDFRLLEQIADEIWVVDKGVKKWDGDIRSYKKHLAKKMAAKTKEAGMGGSANAIIGGASSSSSSSNSSSNSSSSSSSGKKATKK